jgi:hypothetical protein
MAAVLSNQRPCIVEEADRWDKLVAGGFRDLGLERLVQLGMEKKETLVRGGRSVSTVISSYCPAGRGFWRRKLL